MSKLQITDAPASGDGRYYARLVPVVAALLAGGNTLTRDDTDEGFGPSQDGYDCHLNGPIDFDLVQERFVVPQDVWLRPDKDRIVDRITGATIYGGAAFPS